MSKQRFEAEVSTSLKALQGVWMLKVPDVSFFPRGQSPKRIRRPFDFVALYQGQAIALECKQVGISTRFDLGRMRPHQPEALAHFERAGGVSYVLMNFRTPDENRVFALPVEALVHQYFLEASASIPRNWIEENLVEAKRGLGCQATDTAGTSGAWSHSLRQTSIGALVCKRHSKCYNETELRSQEGGGEKPALKGDKGEAQQPCPKPKAQAESKAEGH